MEPEPELSDVTVVAPAERVFENVACPATLNVPPSVALPVAAREDSVLVPVTDNVPGNDKFVKDMPPAENDPVTETLPKVHAPVV